MLFRSAKVAAVVLLALSSQVRLAADEAKDRIMLTESQRERCLEIFREGLASDEFWPAMHAAEGLSRAGLGAEVRAALPARLAKENDDQRRCGLARELVRAGEAKATQVMLDILASDDPHGHVHACESLFKVYQIGDGKLLRQALAEQTPSKKSLMAAAALARESEPAALELLRKYVKSDDAETARICAWILARVGDRRDFESLRSGAERFSDPLTKAYFEHALASLGDQAGQAALVRNLSHPNAAVRIYACEFAPDARVLEAKEPLLRLLNDETLDVRIRAADALLALSQSQKQ